MFKNNQPAATFKDGVGILTCHVYCGALLKHSRICHNHRFTLLRYYLMGRHKIVRHLGKLTWISK